MQQSIPIYSRPILYSFRRCPYAIRARIAIFYAQINVEIREVSLKNKPSHLLEISPKGTVPVLQYYDNTKQKNIIIEESLDIMKWAFQQNDPMNIMHKEYKKVEIQEECLNYKIKSQEKILVYDREKLILQNDLEFKQQLDCYKYYKNYPQKSQIEHRKECNIFLQKLEYLLNKNQYLLGGEISFVDIAIFPFIRNQKDLSNKNMQMQQQSTCGVFCQIESHQGQQISGICLEENCEYNNLICFKCLFQYHSSHLHSIIEINDFVKLMKENSNNIQLQNLGATPILSDQSKELVVKLMKKKDEQTQLKEAVLKTINLYLTQKIDQIDEKIYELQNNSTMVTLQQNIQKLDQIQDISYQELQDLVLFFSPCIQKDSFSQRFSFTANEPNFISDGIDIDVNSLLQKQQHYLETLNDLIIKLQIGLGDLDKSQSPLQSVQKYSISKQNPRQQYPINNLNNNNNSNNSNGNFNKNMGNINNLSLQKRQSYQQINQTPSQNHLNYGNNNIQMGNNQINYQNQYKMPQLQQQQQQQQFQNNTNGNSNINNTVSLIEQNKQEIIQLQQQQLLLQKLEQQKKLDQQKKEQEKFIETKSIMSETRLQLRSTEHFCDALGVEYLQTWAISFKIDSENAFITGFQHFPIFENDSSHYQSLDHAQIDVYIIEGKVIQLGKKIYNQKMAIKKTNKHIQNEENYLEQLSFSKKVAVKKGEMYSLVIVNITEEQYEDPEKRLFFSFGDLAEQTEQEKSQLQFFNSDYTNIQHFLELEDLQSSQIKNDRLEEDQQHLSDYFISNISFQAMISIPQNVNQDENIQSTSQSQTPEQLKLNGYQVKQDQYMNINNTDQLNNSQQENLAQNININNIGQHHNQSGYTKRKVFQVGNGMTNNSNNNGSGNMMNNNYQKNNNQYRDKKQNRNYYQNERSNGQNMNSYERNMYNNMGNTTTNNNNMNTKFNQNMNLFKQGNFYPNKKIKN